MKFETSNLTAENVAKIAELFPGVVAEGKVNFDLLRSMLGDDVFTDEAYEFTWVGKRAAIAEAGRPIRKTLRPCVEESRDWDTTENLYIEGDNLDVLKLLQESYLGKVKMIYIDPPYNTGNDFIYRDDFTRDKDEYDEEAGVYDMEGDRLFRNTETNGRFHSDWCSMMYPRLVLARNLLHDDGVIFISIDDNEQENLKKICDEIFGAGNFVGCVVWERAFAPKNDAKYFSASHDFILVYARKLDCFGIGMMPRTDEANARYKNPDNDPRGDWASDNLTVKTYSAEYDYEITTPSGKKIRPTDGRCWFTNKMRMQELIDDNRVWFGESGDNMPRLKRFLSDVQRGMVPVTIWKYDEVGHNQEGRQEVKKLFSDKGYFDGPKPVRLLSKILRVANTQTDSIILDFFSGSATTAHAIMQLNAEDGGKRKFIMVQLPELCAEGSEAAKAGYKNICEIGKERIRRAGEKIVTSSKLQATRKEDDSCNLELETRNYPVTCNSKLVTDIGFRVFKLADTNMNDVYYAATEYGQDLLTRMESNIKPDRADMDLLFSCLLDWGLPLSMPHTQEIIDGATVHTYNGGDLVACFADKISDAAVRTIAGRRPLRAVFRDSGFSSSPEKINIKELFKLFAPNTNVRVI
jgi:adenine-specific DNA-methyltransferase